MAKQHGHSIGIGTSCAAGGLWRLQGLAAIGFRQWLQTPAATTSTSSNQLQVTIGIAATVAWQHSQATQQQLQQSSNCSRPASQHQYGISNVAATGDVQVHMAHGQMCAPSAHEPQGTCGPVAFGTGAHVRA
eukprot:TRINITY_DN2581_c0_g1_i6.p2 TRINITY_DN2581_c0_g1~~TRINITY_DN2581_c0_g1_i6.p2  ORF type:complete len:132 (-),score=35.44 TRINITY_DN2581_c0_g1_i6:347-742(-)